MIDIGDLVRAGDATANEDVPEPTSAVGQQIMNTARQRGPMTSPRAVSGRASRGARLLVAAGAVSLVPAALVAAFVLAGRQPTPTTASHPGSSSTTPTSPSVVSTAPTTTLGRHPTAPPPYHATSPTAAIVDQIAVNAAHAAGDREVPTRVIWVSTTIGAVTAAIGGSPVNASDGAWMLAIPGAFPSGDHPMAISLKARKFAPAAFLWLEINQRTLQESGGGMGSSATAWILPTFGPSETDSLVGLSPNYQKIANMQAARGGGGAG